MSDLERASRSDVTVHELLLAMLGTIGNTTAALVEMARTCRPCHCRPRKRHNATHVRFVLQGEAMTDIIATVGDAPKKFHANLLKDDETVDTSFQNAEYGYGTASSGVLTAADGSSSIVADGLDVTISFLAASAIVDGAPVPSVVAFDADSDATPEGQQIIPGTINVTVLAPETNATHVTFSEVTP